MQNPRPKIYLLPAAASRVSRYSLAGKQLGFFTACCLAMLVLTLAAAGMIERARAAQPHRVQAAGVATLHFSGPGGEAIVGDLTAQGADESDTARLRAQIRAAAMRH